MYDQQRVSMINASYHNAWTAPTMAAAVRLCQNVVTKLFGDVQFFDDQLCMWYDAGDNRLHVALAPRLSPVAHR